MADICLVTEELVGFTPSGGIGAAFTELAFCLAKKGHNVKVLICPITFGSVNYTDSSSKKFHDAGVRVEICPTTYYVASAQNYAEKSYAIARHLIETDSTHDFIHFHDYKGLGFFTITAKKLGMFGMSTTIILQAHGTTRWTLDVNQSLFTHADQLRIDYMERFCIANCDKLVSPSQYLIDWFGETHVEMPKSEDVYVIKNVCTDLIESLTPLMIERSDDRQVQSVVFFGRHEDRKGLTIFCDAIRLIEETLIKYEIEVHFVGGFGSTKGMHSGLYLSRLMNDLDVSFSVTDGLGRFEALSKILALDSPVVVVASPEENSPYAVLEPLVLGIPVITSNAGGAIELIAESDRSESTVDMNSAALSERLERVIKNGIKRIELAESGSRIEEMWLKLHNKSNGLESVTTFANKEPKVVLGITTFERPHKVVDAIFSAARQTYKNLEIVVVDDGSTKPETVLQLPYISNLLERFGGKLIVRENGYLGAARNTIIRETKSDYVIFLDDDDIALEDMVSTLVQAAEYASADIVASVNVFMDESLRSHALANPEDFGVRPSYIPMGGPLSLGPIENVFGSATSLIKRSVFADVGLYSELRGVGHEDYEFYFRASQCNKKFFVCPQVGFLYEVGRPSMISNTSTIANFRRVVEELHIERNPRSWLDFISLQTGAASVRVEQDRRNWMNEQSPQRDLLTKIYNGSQSDRDVRGLLVEYCLSTMMLRAANCWANGYPQYQSQISILSNEKSSSQISSMSFEDVLDEAAVLAALEGKYKLCTSIMARDVARRQSIDSRFMNTALFLLKKYPGSIEQNVISRMASKVQQWSVPGELEVSAMAFRCCIYLSDERWEEAYSTAQQVVAIEESWYRGSHDGESWGADVSAINHYVTIGRLLGYGGFDFVKQIASFLSRVAGRRVFVNQVISVSRSLLDEKLLKKGDFSK